MEALPPAESVLLNSALGPATASGAGAAASCPGSRALPGFRDSANGSDLPCHQCAFLRALWMACMVPKLSVEQIQTGALVAGSMRDSVGTCVRDWTPRNDDLLGRSILFGVFKWITHEVFLMISWSSS